VKPLGNIVMQYGSDKMSWPDRIIEASRHDPQIQQAIEPILTPRHPSQLYEAFLEGVVLFTILWILRTRFRMPRGMITGVFFILYAALRIIGETFRVPDAAWRVGRFSAGQFLSLFMFLIGAAFIAFAWRARVYEKVDRRG
jgi:phosphatidylglycerol:prolipoprotein diacylglycerol transferase